MLLGRLLEKPDNDRLTFSTVPGRGDVRHFRLAISLESDSNAWTRAAKPVSAFAGAGTIALLLLTLGVEASQFRQPEVGIFGLPMAVPAMLAVGLSLVGLAVAALVCAVVPGRDPFDLSERGRTAYVYGVEVLVADEADKAPAFGNVGIDLGRRRIGQPPHRSCRDIGCRRARPPQADRISSWNW